MGDGMGAMTRLREALTFLGALSSCEAARALGVTRRHVARLARADDIGRDSEGRYSIHAPTAKAERPCVAAIRPLVEDGCDVYADWLCERTGYKRRAVYDALRELGFAAGRGRCAVWSRKRAA